MSPIQETLATARYLNLPIRELCRRSGVSESYFYGALHADQIHAAVTRVVDEALAEAKQTPTHEATNADA